MNSNTGINFGDFKKQERFKKLELDLKLKCVKEIERIKASDGKANRPQYSNTSPTWPSLSSINADGLDSSCTNYVPSLQVSRVGSEVVSSSNNLCNVFKVFKRDIDQIPIATSSLKKFPIKKFDEDSIIMPPPPPANFKCYKTKGLSNINSIRPQNIQQNTIEKSLTKVHDALTSGTFNSNDKDSVSSMLDIQESKGYRTFSNWRVLLNEQNQQLVIKGTLECGKIARSKPVVHRFTNTKVQSIFKHIYILNGHIVDDRYELPDYVRGKFHNGFPDDWENVYELWKRYILEGSKPSFRWPKPITDSDDDLNSEITEFICSKKKPSQSMEEAQFSKFSYNISSSGYHSKECNQNLDKSQEKINEQPLKVRHLNKNVDDNNCEDCNSVIKDTSTSIGGCATAKCTETHSTSASCSTSNLKNTSFLYEVIQEDKLRIILSNLGDKNCPPEYLDRFIEMINCLNFILSYNQSKNLETNSSKENIPLPQNQNIGCKNCNTSSFSETVEAHLFNKDNINVNEDKIQCLKDNRILNTVKQYKYPEHTDCAELQDNIIQHKSEDSDISVNEVYMGIPNLNLHRLIHNKISRSERYQYRKNRCKDRKNIKNEKKISTIEDKKNKSYSSLSDSNDQQNTQYPENRSPQLKKDTTVKQLPVVKSYEPVNINLKIKRPLRNKVNSDISIIDEIPIKIQKTSNSNSNNSANKKAENFSKDVEKHPFLTYDSEDFPTDEINDSDQLNNSNNPINDNSEVLKTNNKGNNRKSLSQGEFRRRLESDNDAISLNQLFGSKENPKQLASWVPCVAYSKNKESYLIFEGKILNEAGHILHRKYTTDRIHQRHSSKLLETVNNEFFLLVGEMNDSKHVVPKQLIRYCRNGCPSNIVEFCNEWQNQSVLENNTTSKSENLHNVSIDMFMIPTSSRGRKIIPPLNYWNGERLLIKDNETVYDPGNLKDNALLKKIVTTKEAMRISECQTKHSSKETKTRYSKSCTKSLASLHSPETHKAVKKRVIQKLKYSSDSDDSSSKKKVILPPVNAKNKIKENSQQNFKKFNLRSREKKDDVTLWSLDKEQYNDILSDDQRSVLVRR